MRRTALRRPEGLDRYRILGKIGEGTYGMVFKAEAYASSSAAASSSSSGGTKAKDSGGSAAAGEEEEPMVFAIKLVKSHKEGKNDVVLSSATVREIKLLRELNHDNVVHLHDVHVDPREKTLALVFEYADHDLHDIVVQSKQKPLSEYTKKSLMYQILKGVDYMHDAWVMHRDMKPQNILVVGHGRKRGQVKLADFGLARLYKEPIKALSDVERVVVTLWYRAPELLLDAKHYTKAVDMWAAGCIFAEIVNGRELFCGKEVEGSKAPFQKDQLDKIFKVLGMPTPQTWEGMEHLPEYPQVVQMGRERKYPTQSELKNAVKFGAGRSGMALYDLISRMLEYDPEKRITAKEALEHEYFKQIEPEPRDWAFDEPGKEPVAFRTQTVEPVADESLPWKIRKDGDKNPMQHSDAAAAGGATGAGSPSRDRASHHHSSSSTAQTSDHRRDSSSSRGGRPSGGAPSASGTSSRDASRRDHESNGGRGGAGWRDRSVGRGESSSSSGAPATAAGGTSSNKRPPPSASSASSDRPGSDSSRPRSPKQQRRR